ncbi:SurA N-terminal domain-containing protein [Pelagibacteraceae bacterium]|nr:SurA N-terminal domain-containing protein [Pelagibacteraceae bacterium]
MKNSIHLKILFFLFVFLLNTNFLNADEKRYKIIKLVNEQVITNYDLEQRVKLFAVLRNAQINQDNYNVIASEILSTMVDEKLQLEKMIEYKINITESEVTDYLKRAYTNDNVNIGDLFNALKLNGIDHNILKEMIKINLGWQKLTGNLYYRSSNVNTEEVDKLMLEEPNVGRERAEQLLLQDQIDLRAKKLLRDIKSEANIENR